MKRHRGDRRPKYLVYKIDADLVDQLGLDGIGNRLNLIDSGRIKNSKGKSNSYLDNINKNNINNSGSLT